MRLEEHVRLSRLLDAYGALLTERQRCVLDQYVNEDLSLFELSELHEISRQGVRDAILKAGARLESFENKLGFLARIDATDLALKAAAAVAGTLTADVKTALLTQFERIANCWNYTLED